MKHANGTLWVEEEALPGRAGIDGRSTMEDRGEASSSAEATVFMPEHESSTGSSTGTTVGRWIGVIAVLGYASICAILFYRTSLP